MIFERWLCCSDYAALPPGQVCQVCHSPGVPTVLTVSVHSSGAPLPEAVQGSAGRTVLLPEPADVKGTGHHRRGGRPLRAEVSALLNHPKPVASPLRT